MLASFVLYGMESPNTSGETWTRYYRATKESSSVLVASAVCQLLLQYYFVERRTADCGHPVLADCSWTDLEARAGGARYRGCSVTVCVAEEQEAETLLSGLRWSRRSERSLAVEKVGVALLFDSL